ncbi:hypothetical protein Mjas_04210 [Methanothermococcus sp. Ax23]|uniref:hypothetical protein n=1 Tax=Methanothermococcus sp. Ax23 TaxID=3156486 RepID=UPI003BA08762
MDYWIFTLFSLSNIVWTSFSLMFLLIFLSILKRKLNKIKSGNKLYSTKISVFENIKYNFEKNKYKYTILIIIGIIYWLIMLKILYMDNITVISFTVLIFLLLSTIFAYMVFIKKYYNIEIYDKGIIWDDKPLNWKSFDGYKVNRDKIVLYNKHLLGENNYCLNYNKELEDIFKNHLNEIK